jgi:hypothetical protein
LKRRRERARDSEGKAMKGFKPMGRSMSHGFRYPASMGFTGSTGGVQQVSGYTRRFATGGFVRQDNPREKVEGGIDPGRATVSRSRPSSNLDQQAGGRSPLRPGYRKGGKATLVKGALSKVRDAIRNRGVDPRNTHATLPAESTSAGRKAARTSAVKRAMKGAAANPGVDPQDSHATQAAKFAENAQRRGRDYGSGGGVKKKFAEGGKVGLLKKALESAKKPWSIEAHMEHLRRRDRMDRRIANDPLLKGERRTTPDRRTRTHPVPKEVEDAVTRKMLETFKRRGGAVRYQKGGGVSAEEAKHIAERVVGTHVRYPAPEGHKGFAKIYPARR